LSNSNGNDNIKKETSNKTTIICDVSSWNGCGRSGDKFELNTEQKTTSEYPSNDIESQASDMVLNQIDATPHIDSGDPSLPCVLGMKGTFPKSDNVLDTEIGHSFSTPGGHLHPFLEDSVEAGDLSMNGHSTSQSQSGSTLAIDTQNPIQCPQASASENAARHLLNPLQIVPSLRYLNLWRHGILSLIIK
jgi:hypothetical protein